MTQILVLDSRIKLLLGNIGDEQIDPKTLFSFRDNNLNVCLAEVTTSTNNQTGEQITRALQQDTLDYVGLPSDFFRPIWCETVDDLGNRLEYIETVNLGDLINRDSHHKAIAFRGTDPVHYRISWSPSGQTTLRIVYKPGSEHEKTRASNIQFCDLFLWKIATDTAVDLVPFVDFAPQMIKNPDVKRDIERSLLRDGGLVDRWSNAWHTEMFRAPIEGPTYMRPFSAYHRR
jgi:hypothetical protein